MTYISNTGRLDSNNSSTTALNNAQTFTGTGTDVSQYNSIVVACLTDQNGTLYVEFSPDNTNWDSSLSYTVTASTNEIHRIAVTRRYVRVRLTNNSGSNQTYLRLQTIIGHQTQLTSALNSTIQSDSDTIAVRPLDFNSMVTEGLYQNRAPIFKEGINLDIDTGSVPEDLWNNGGAYTGFPLTAAAGEIVVAGADTGTVYYSYLESTTSEDYVIGAISITGAGTYALGHNIYRSNFAYFDDGSGFNVGAITLRHTATPANIFWTIDAGYGQTQCAAYTVPYNSTLLIDRFNGNMRGANSGSLDGFIWWREYGASPRLRFAFELQYGSFYFDDVDYLTRIPALTDFVPRIVTCSANNLSAKFTMRFIKIKN